MIRSMKAAILIYALMFSQIGAVAQNGCATGIQVYGYPPVAQGANIQDRIGSFAGSFLYQYDPTVSSLQEAEYRLGTNSTTGYTDANLIDPDTGVKAVGLGTHVIKIWFNYQDIAATGNANNYPNSGSDASYPLTNFGTVNSLTDLASSAPMKQLFNDPDFTTYILEAGEFCQKTTSGAWTDTRWKVAASPTVNFGSSVQSCVYQDFYNVTQYLLSTYSGTGKTFILQNWEGDNALEASAFTPVPAVTETCTNPNESNYPANFCQTIFNMRTWLNLRWQGVNDARNPAKTTYNNVTVAAASESNLVTGWNNGSNPTVMSLVVPYLHMDLYSCSCYHTDNLTDAQVIYPELQTYRSYIVQPVLATGSSPTLYGTNDLYIGEFSADETQFYSDDDWTETTSRSGRMLTGQQVQGMLANGVRYISFWELYSNGLLASSDTIDGVWLIRPPCNTTDNTQSWCTDTSHTGQMSKTQTWDYLANIMTQPYSSYQYVYEAENFYTKVTNTGSEVDIADSNMTGGYGTELSGAAVNSMISYSMYVPTSGTQTLSIRAKTNNSHGIFAVHLNGTALPGTFDTYSSSQGYQTYTITTQSIPPGTTTVDVVVTGKNSSSSAYNLVLDNISIVPGS
jgi:hypothetical protein